MQLLNSSTAVILLASILSANAIPVHDDSIPGLQVRAPQGYNAALELRPKKTNVKRDLVDTRDVADLYDSNLDKRYDQPIEKRKEYHGEKPAEPPEHVGKPPENVGKPPEEVAKPPGGVHTRRSKPPNTEARLRIREPENEKRKESLKASSLDQLDLFKRAKVPNPSKAPPPNQIITVGKREKSLKAPPPNQIITVGKREKSLKAPPPNQIITVGKREKSLKAPPPNQIITVGKREKSLKAPPPNQIITVGKREKSLKAPPPNQIITVGKRENSLKAPPPEQTITVRKRENSLKAPPPEQTITVRKRDSPSLKAGPPDQRIGIEKVKARGGQISKPSIDFKDGTPKGGGGEQ